MKILFLAKGHESLSIEILSAVLKRAGHQVELLFDPGLDDLLGFLSLRIFKQTDDEWYLKRIQQFAPALVCFSALTNLYSFVKEKAALIKRHFDVPILVGGIHPTIVPEYVISNPHIDMICIGEGDEALVELCDRMQRGADYYDVKNFWFKCGDEIVKNDVRPLVQDLDALPFPDRELFFKYGTFAGTLYLATGRGCPFTCSYCCHHFLQKKYRGLGTYVRRRSVASVIRELEECVRACPVKTVYSMDDTFTLDEQWVEEFAESYRRRINLPLYCHVRPGTVSQRMLDALKKANCHAVFYGTDSGNEQMLFQLMNRRIKRDSIIEGARLLKQNGFTVTTSAIFCLPDESVEQMMDTVNLIKEIDSDYAYSYIYYPFPETDSFSYCVERGLLDRETIDRIYEGEGSFHQYSLLQHGEQDLGQTLKNILPFMIAFPRLRRLADAVVRRRLVGLSRLIFMASAPITYAEYGRNKLREIWSVARATRRQK